MSCLSENQLAGFADNALALRERDAVERHISACRGCREIVARLAPDQPPPTQADAEAVGEVAGSLASRLIPGSTVGRFVILQVLGEGGMGIVYSAYDPHLDRRVALKVVRPEAGTAASLELRARMMREAQALARVSHPNVIHIYEVGTLGQQLFLVMEFMEGGTLKDWLQEQDRPWHEVLDQFFYAGRGLAAAHAAGLTHRDFKAENVLIRRDGRVCVSDFGLARQGAVLDDLGAPAPEGRIEESVPFRAHPHRLTQTGAVLGTLGYMAPEQLLGKSTDSRSDQFAFCVAAYEALYGNRPFPGSTLSEILDSMRANRIHTPESHARVPSRVRRVLLRGLSFDPSARFPSLNELLRALRHDPVHRWKRIGIVAAVLVSCALSGLFLLIHSRPPLCQGGEQRLHGIWDRTRKNAIAAAFRATGAPFAEDAWGAVRRALDRYAQDWVAMHAEACQATRERGEQSDEVLGLRMDCLDQRLKEVEALTRVFANADGEVVEKAGSAAQGLGELDLCANVPALRAHLHPPDLRIRDRVDALRGSLARAKALQVAGKYGDADKLLLPVAQDARSLGYRPLLAAALMQLGELQRRIGKTAEAEATFRTALGEAKAAGDEVSEAAALMNLMPLLSVDEGRPEAAKWLSDLATATVRHLGDPPMLRAQLHYVLGVQNRTEHLFSESIANSKIALKLFQQQLGGESAAAVRCMMEIGSAFEDQGDLDAALEAYQRALPVMKSVFGRTHPELMNVYVRIATVQMGLGQIQEGMDNVQVSLEIQNQLKSPPPRFQAAAYETLGHLLFKSGERDKALAAFKRMEAILAKNQGTNQHDGAILHQDLGLAHRLRREYPQAGKHLQLALRAYRAADGDRSQYIGEVYIEQGTLAFDQRRYWRALTLQRRGLALVTHHLGVDSPDRAKALEAVGETELALREPVLARRTLEEALQLRLKYRGDPLDLAQTRLALASAVWLSTKDRQAAISMAEAARRELESAENVRPVVELRTAIEKWRADLARSDQRLAVIPGVDTD